MEEALTQLLADVRSSDQGVQNSAYKAVMEPTDVPVAWAYELWDRVVADLGDVDNYVRAIADTANRPTPSMRTTAAPLPSRGR